MVPGLWIAAGEAKFTAIGSDPPRFAGVLPSRLHRSHGTVRAATQSMNRNDIIAAAGWLGFLAALIAAAGTAG